MAEPILWAEKAKPMRRQLAKRYNPKTDKVEQLFDDETGEPVWEKIPQRGHVGEKFVSEHPKWRPTNAAHFLKHCGNEVRVNLVNAAAQQDPDTKHKRERLAKARHFGWIRVGQCPLVLCMTDALIDLSASWLALSSPVIHRTRGHCPTRIQPKCLALASRSRLCLVSGSC